MTNVPALTMRRAAKSELPIILALYQQLSPEVLELSVAEQIWERMAHYPAYAVYVVEREQQIIGTLALLVLDNLGHRGAPLGIVENVVVDSAYRGEGIGKAMMHWAMAQCRAAGCYKLMLSSNLNREAAHRFYEELGFDKHGYSFLVPLQP
jgi:GNAT superfamily N-acetyltransferase